MERVRLTPGRIEKATCPNGKEQAFTWDTESPRLAVRVTAKGAKSFVFEGKLKRKTIRVTIGDVRVWILEDARKEANRLQAIIDKGDDPRELKQEKRERKAAEKAAKAAARKRAEERKKYTLRALCKVYADYLTAQGKGKSAGDAMSAFKCHVFEPHPEISDTPADEVTARQIADIVRRVIEQGKKRTAGILRSYLCAAYNKARQAPFHGDLPAAMIPFNIEQNPVEPVGAIPVDAGDRHLSAEELKVYIDRLGDDLPGLALKLALYAGGQRMAPLLRAKVTDYDAEEKILRLWDHKGRRRAPREHLLPLGPVAASIVDTLLARAGKNESTYLFASRGSVVSYATPGKQVKEIATAMGVEPFDLRDIRRTVETMLVGLGLSRDIRAQVLSHGITGVQAKHYDRHSYLKEKHLALQKWERHLDRLRTNEKSKKVVNLQRK